MFARFHCFISDLMGYHAHIIVHKWREGDLNPIVLPLNRPPVYETGEHSELLHPARAGYQNRTDYLLITSEMLYLMS